MQMVPNILIPAAPGFQGVPMLQGMPMLRGIPMVQGMSMIQLQPTVAQGTSLQPSAPAASLQAMPKRPYKNAENRFQIIYIFLFIVV